MGLNYADAKLLKSLVNSRGRISSLTLSKDLEIPLSTVQRRRKKLETEYLTICYSLKPEKFGLRRIDLLVGTLGPTKAIVRDLMERKEVFSVARTIGQHTVDLRVEVLVKTNEQLLDLLEYVKSIKKVRGAEWIEALDILARRDINNFSDYVGLK